MIEAYRKDIDRTLICENLKLTPEQRLLQLMTLQEFADELRRASRWIWTVYRRTPDNSARVAESVARATPLVSSSLGRHLAYSFRARNSRCQFCTTDKLETALILPSGIAAIPR